MRKLVIIFTLFSCSLSGWAQSNIVAAEYFFDTDPGMGAALPISGVTTATTIDVNNLIDVSSLALGMHTLGIRVLDDNSVWSMVEYIPVFVTLGSATTVSNITSAEYFFDTDPGLGGANPIALTSLQNIDINELFPTSSLSFGMHTINIRIKNQYDEWSMTESIPVFVTSTNANIMTDIDRVEYFFDNDPGLGAATAITISAAQNIDISSLIPTAPLALGMHTLNIRIRTINGEWSITESIPVYVDQSRQITQLEHFVDTDPGVGSATNVPIVPPTNNLDFNLNVPTSSLAVGPHTLAVRLGGVSNVWGITEYVAFNICTGANANFSAITTCIGDATNFADLSTNVLAGDTYSWDFDGDLIEDDNTIGSTSFTYSATGSYTATLTIDRAGCPSIFSVVVDVVDPPSVDVGLDQVICETDIASLVGLGNASASNPMWSTSGDGMFSNQTSFSSNYTPGSSDISSGSASLTLTVDGPGTCPQVSDQLTLLISPPIIAGTLTLGSSVGQAANVDVIASSSTNIGDIIQVTITQSPAKGTVAIQSDNTIDYTASNATVGADSFSYQICNQCNLCSTGTVSIDILNEPPIIAPPSTPIAGVAGQTVVIPFLSFVSDLNDNIDPSSIHITSAPTSSATTSFDNNFNLVLDYANTPFTGTDQVTVEVCDLLGACSSITLTIEIDGEITVFNGISPNGDGDNDFFFLQNIQFIEPQNTVSIYNRWGDKVFAIENYDSANPDKRFNGVNTNGKEVTSGVYFYKVEFTSGRESMSGYLTLKR